MYESVLGDHSVVFFDNGFYDVDESKPLWFGQKRRKTPNPFSCTAPSFMKRPIKDSIYDREDCSCIYCFTPQLCDRAEKVNRNQERSYVPFIEVAKESLGKDFNPADLILLNAEIRRRARNSVTFRRSHNVLRKRG